VTERRQVFSAEERARRLQRAADQLCHEAILLDAGPSEVRAIIDAKWKELRREAQANETSEERKKK
jgi:hypothetical protein